MIPPLRSLFAVAFLSLELVPVAAMGGVWFLTASGDLMERAVSSRSLRQNVPWEHYNMLPREEREWMDARMKDAGVTIEQVASGLRTRC